MLYIVFLIVSVALPVTFVLHLHTVSYVLCTCLFSILGLGYTWCVIRLSDRKDVQTNDYNNPANDKVSVNIRQ